jgi:hypothetical protein
MANRTLYTFRVFTNFYLCDACPNEWSTEMMVVAHDWCPCCGAKCDPYDYEALLDEVEVTEEVE